MISWFIQTDYKRWENSVFFFLSIHLKNLLCAALHICNSSRYDFSTTLSLPGIYLASHGLLAVSVAWNGPSFVGGGPISIWPSGV